MPKKITFGLSVSEVRKAIKEVEQYKKEFNQKTYKLALRLAKEGIYIARMELSGHKAIDTGKLISSLETEYQGVVDGKETFSIYTDCEYAKYVEFGFGIVGQGSPHPDTSILGWKYDINDHGESGWHYMGEDGEWHWSKGQPSKPFMYETGKQLKAKVLEIAREVYRT